MSKKITVTVKSLLKNQKVQNSKIADLERMNQLANSDVNEKTLQIANLQRDVAIFRNIIQDIGTIVIGPNWMNFCSYHQLGDRIREDMTNHRSLDGQLKGATEMAKILFAETVQNLHTKNNK